MKTSIYISIALLAASTQLALAAEGTTPLSNVALFTRCYTQMTGQALPRNHPIRQEVAAGTLAPVAACMQVLQEASLIASGANVGHLVNDTPEGRMVLKTFNDVHRSWFHSDRLIPSITGEGLTYSQYLYDETEDALFVTRSLFYPNVPYSDVVTDSNDMEAIRDLQGQPYPAPWWPMAVNNMSYVGTNYQDIVNGPNVLFSPSPRGQLEGVVSYADDPDQSKYNLYVSRDSFTFSYLGIINTGAYPHRPTYSGGGAMATASFLILNNFGGWDDGGYGANRVWSRAVYNDLLCRDVPVIRISDALPFVEASPPTSIPFRAQSQCMQCHAAMDPMSGVVRNSWITQNPYVADANGNLTNAPPTLAFTFQQLFPPEVGQVDSDGYFMERPPTGHFMFRSYNGTLVQANLSNMADLGTTISKLPDFYNCAASRYLSFFTGVTVNWLDIGDPSVTNATQIQADPYRAFAIQLGTQLQQTQSLSGMIQTILQSPLYQSNSMRSSQ
jgi:hypothetical protein